MIRITIEWTDEAKSCFICPNKIARAIDTLLKCHDVRALGPKESRFLNEH